jgi:hypothetical protein
MFIMRVFAPSRGVVAQQRHPLCCAQSYGAAKPPMWRFTPLLFEFEKCPSNNGEAIRAHWHTLWQQMRGAFRHRLVACLLWQSLAEMRGRAADWRNSRAF